jgi:hypothetical protein
MTALKFVRELATSNMALQPFPTSNGISSDWCRRRADVFSGAWDPVAVCVDDKPQCIHARKHSLRSGALQVARRPDLAAVAT